MIIKKGNLFNTTATYIGHGVNTHGLMGAGIAKVFQEKYPRNYADYRKLCLSGELVAGDFSAFLENHKVVVNFASQDKPGPFARYSWIEESFTSFAKSASKTAQMDVYGSRIAIPMIGCGIGGLRWDKVEDIINKVERDSMLKFEVWML